VNIGAGAVTCNFDGDKKHKTHIKSKAFIGSGTMIVAPIIINEGAKIGAGSVLTQDVQKYSLVYGVPAKKIRDLR
jgi:bifunctional UDP-N-acetylglucosamine pyrophosphorylase/glucosamine-1-phosphate N-acetyltransferase